MGKKKQPEVPEVSERYGDVKAGVEALANIAVHIMGPMPMVSIALASWLSDWIRFATDCGLITEAEAEKMIAELDAEAEAKAEGEPEADELMAAIASMPGVTVVRMSSDGGLEQLQS